MVRPQRLVAVGEALGLEGRAARMGRSEGCVSFGAPILNQDDLGEVAHERVDDRHDLVAAPDRERAPRHEIGPLAIGGA